MSLLINNYKKGYEKGFVDFAEILKEITIKKLFAILKMLIKKLVLVHNRKLTHGNLIYLRRLPY